MRPTVHQKLRTQGDLAPELSEGWTGGRAQVNFKRCHRSLNCPATSGYKLRRRGPSWYGLNVMSPGTPVPFTRSRDCSILSLSSTWGRADRQTLLTRIESGAFCFVPTLPRKVCNSEQRAHLLVMYGSGKEVVRLQKSGSSLVGGHGLMATFDPHVRPHHR